MNRYYVDLYPLLRGVLKILLYRLRGSIHAHRFKRAVCFHNKLYFIFVAGWSSPVARQAHNLKVVGSNPTPATNLIKELAAL